MRKVAILFLLLCSIKELWAQDFLELLPNVTHQLAANGPYNYKSLLDTLHYKLVRNDGYIVPHTNPKISRAIDNIAYVFNSTKPNYTIFQIDSINEIHRVNSGFSQLFAFPSGYNRTIAADSSNRLGIIDCKGDFKAYLDSSITTVRSFSDGLAVISSEQGLGYIDTLGNVVIEPKFTEAYRFNCGHAIVKKPHNGDYIIIDKKGHEKAHISVIDYVAPLPPKTPTFYCGLLTMWRKDDTVMLDLNGTEVWKMNGRWTFNSAVDSIILLSQKGLYRVVDTKGNILLENPAPIWLLGADRLAVKDGNEIHLYNLQGQHIFLSSAFKFIRPFYDGRTAFATTIDGRWIIIDKDGHEIREITELHGWDMHPRISLLPPFEDYISKEPKRL